MEARGPDRFLTSHPHVRAFLSSLVSCWLKLYLSRLQTFPKRRTHYRRRISIQTYRVRLTRSDVYLRNYVARDDDVVVCWIDQTIDITWLHNGRCDEFAIVVNSMKLRRYICVRYIIITMMTQALLRSVIIYGNLREALVVQSFPIRKHGNSNGCCIAHRNWWPIIVPYCSQLWGIVEWICTTV